MKSFIPDHSIRLFGIACLARNRAKESARRSPDSPHPDSSVAVVMAAASAEGLMNELGEVSSGYLGDLDPALPNLGNILDEIEKSKGTTLFKYLMASLILSGTMFDKGGSIYEDLKMLFDLRNQYMHLPVVKRRDSVEGELQAPRGKLFKGLQGRGLVRKDPGPTWMSAMQTAEMAEWACRAASNAMIAILEMLPYSAQSQLEWKGAIMAHLDSTEFDF